MEYFADRLELSVLDQLKASYVQKDGLWVYPGWGSGENACLVAWWQDGVLRGLSLVHLPSDDSRAVRFREQLKQIVWAGELEGWVTGEPAYHLVAEPEEAEAWRVLFEEGTTVDVAPPVPAEELASLTARRVACNGVSTNLLPPEAAARYRQRFNDRLWMRGLGAVIALYLIGVAVYFGWVEVANWKLDSVKSDVAALANSYTNALQLREEVKVLQNQLDLRYAALECWKVTSDNLPTELTLGSLSFERGRKLTLIGVAPSDAGPLVNDFNDNLRNAVVGDKRLFKQVDGARLTENPANRQITWTFACYLDREDQE
jgi:hypothetical protein